MSHADAAPAGAAHVPSLDEPSLGEPSLGEPSLGDLFGDLSREVGTLVRQEVRLASTELRQKVSGLGRDLGLVALGGALVYAGVLALVAALVFLLALVLPWWLAALVVGLVVAGLGYALVRSGLDALRQQDFAPRATLRSLQEDVAMVRREVA